MPKLTPQRTILYYPTIDIPNTEWLKHAIFYWDEVSSIIPQDWQDKFLTELSSDIQFLLDEGEFRAVRPEELIWNSSNEDVYQSFKREFKDTIKSDRFNRMIGRAKDKLFKIHGAKLRDIALIAGSRIHRNKTTDGIYDFLAGNKLAKVDPQNSDWIRVERNTALLYMSLLAKYLAIIDRNQMEVGTDYSIYEALNFKKVKNREGIPVAKLSLNNVLPSPRKDVELKEIIRFKRKRMPELFRLRNIIRNYQNELISCEGREHMKEITLSFQEEYISSMNDLFKSSKEFKISFLWKSLKSLISLESSTAAVTLGNAVFNAPTVVEIAGYTIAGAVDIGTTYIESRNELLTRQRDSAFAYLYQAQRKRIINPVAY